MYKEEHQSATYKPWREKGEIKDCDPTGTTKSIIIHDTPSITVPPGGRRHVYGLWFAIVLRSAKDCPCDEPGDAEDYAYLNIVVDKNQLKNAKLTIGQWKKNPNYPAGLPLRPTK